MPRPLAGDLGTPEHLTALYERVVRLERRRLRSEVEFSLAGAIAISTSGPWVAQADCTLYEVRCLLGTSGSSSTVVTVYVNGSSIGTVTLTSGQTNEATTFDQTLVADTDVVSVGVTTAGTGAAALTVLARVA